MNDFSAVAAIITSVVALINLVIMIAGILSIKGGIKIIHQQTNGMKDELVREVRASSLAKGAFDERERERLDERP